MERLKEIQKKLTDVTVSSTALNCLIGHMMITAQSTEDLTDLSELLSLSADMIEKIADNMEDACDTLYDVFAEIIDTGDEEDYDD